MDYFYYTKFEDPRLIRSAVFTKKITEYLQFQTNYTEEGFIKSVDEILLKASVNPEVSDFALNYLLELFLAVGPDIVLDYLVEEYVMNGACSQLDASAILSARLNAYENLQLGMSAPNFHILNADGVVQNLKDICSFYKINILFFASSHCQFCHEITPELLQYSKSTNNKLLQVVHISLDTNYSEWQNSTKNFPANWVSLSELKGWDSKSTELFQIHKTPSFYILDQNANIISKPKNMEELIQDLQLLSP
ncbi:MAG: hypothetical protein B7C24_01445 [Bacteroidetes bacterium 4572_77]|nr:MAG: hypothetical protein B7C24_01445 [Bacteroidetes bacterium 4572_77]